jgi:hypothetical protein
LKYTVDFEVEIGISGAEVVGDLVPNVQGEPRLEAEVDNSAEALNVFAFEPVMQRVMKGEL